MTKNRHKGRAARPKNERPRVTWPQSLRDMVVASINRGQLPIFGFFFVVVSLIWKMPPEDVSKLVFELIETLKAAELIAYIVSGLLAIGWYSHARIMRKIYSDEFARIGREKTTLQSQVSGTPYKSSDKP